jgi:hypothetical protein
MTKALTPRPTRNSFRFNCLRRNTKPNLEASGKPPARSQEIRRGEACLAPQKGDACVAPTNNHFLLSLSTVLAMRKQSTPTGIPQ